VRLTNGYFALLLAIIALSPSQAAAPTSPIERYRVHISGGGLGIETDDTTVFSSTGSRWIAEHVRHDHNWCGDRSSGRCAPSDKLLHQWADGDSCPALSEAMSIVPKVWAQDLADPTRQQMLVSETPYFTMHRGSNSVRSKPSDEIGEWSGGLRTWWASMLQDTSGCWNNSPPDVNGKPVQPATIEKG